MAKWSRVIFLLLALVLALAQVSLVTCQSDGNQTTDFNNSQSSATQEPATAAPETFQPEQNTNQEPPIQAQDPAAPAEPADPAQANPPPEGVPPADTPVPQTPVPGETAAPVAPPPPATPVPPQPDPAATTPPPPAPDQPEPPAQETPPPDADGAAPPNPDTPPPAPDTPAPSPTPDDITTAIDFSGIYSLVQSGGSSEAADDGITDTTGEDGTGADNAPDTQEEENTDTDTIADEKDADEESQSSATGVSVSQERDHGASTGVQVAIGLGGAVGIAVVALIFVTSRARKRRLKEEDDKYTYNVKPSTNDLSNSAMNGPATIGTSTMRASSSIPFEPHRTPSGQDPPMNQVNSYVPSPKQGATFDNSVDYNDPHFDVLTPVSDIVTAEADTMSYREQEQDTPILDRASERVDESMMSSQSYLYDKYRSTSMKDSVPVMSDDFSQRESSFSTVHKVPARPSVQNDSRAWEESEFNLKESDIMSDEGESKRFETSVFSDGEDFPDAPEQGGGFSEVMRGFQSEASSDFGARSSARPSYMDSYVQSTRDTSRSTAVSRFQSEFLRRSSAVESDCSRLTMEEVDDGHNFRPTNLSEDSALDGSERSFRLSGSQPHPEGGRHTRSNTMISELEEGNERMSFESDDRPRGTSVWESTHKFEYEV